MKKMKRRVQALFLAMLMVVTALVSDFTPVTDAYAAGSTKVTFHYQRTDGEYDDWDLWVWPEGGDGGAVAFTGSDSYGKIATYEVNSDVSEVGFIVRKGGDSWSDKDISDDRKITIENGVAEVWLKQGDATIYTSVPDGTISGTGDSTSTGNNDSTASESEYKTTVVLHYTRPDENYTGWNLWAWNSGAEGKAYKFDYEDDFGKVAVVQLKDECSELGFIVRLNEWEDKDISDDRTIAVSDGFAEVWITSGESDFATTAPAGATAFDLSQVNTGSSSGGSTQPAEGEVLLNLHYHRYDEIYDDWNIWFWPEGGDGAAYTFNGKDDFGVVASYAFDASAKLGFIVRLGEWQLKECDADRYIDLTEAVDGVLDIYLVQSDMELYKSIEEVDLSPKFLGASLTTVKRIACKVTVPLDTAADSVVDDFKVVDVDGNEYPIASIVSTGSSEVSSTFNINLQSALDLGNSYKVVSETYGETSIAFSAVFSTEEFEEAYTYEGDDLGAVWTADSTTFKVWAPVASKVVLNLYKDGKDGDAYSTVEMTKGEKGVWSVTQAGDLNKVYYTYTITNNGVENEVVDLYARTTGVNGKRGMVIDLDSTDPEGWADDKRPTTKNATDACIYELHIRDFSIDASSGVENKGKYLGLAEKGTKNTTGQSTCLDYLKELGITHVQILPMYDYSPNSVNEDKLDQEQFNWGYDPYNYNVPEGSYSTDPYHGEVRVNEVKQMVQALHNENIGVVMDVVYNHTAESGGSYFNLTVPDYYYRLTEDGKFSNASGCGNEVASDRAMVRKYIVDSVVYWATEYHIDGFRFDLMGILDMKTMNEIRARLTEIDPSILVYGEGWTGGDSVLESSLRAMKYNTYRMEGVGAFSDDIRDGIKGSVFDKADKGFATGAEGKEERIKSGVVGATDYKGINWSATGTDISTCWTTAPTQAINYVSCHDNLTLWDKINSSNADDTEEDRIKMNKLSASIVYTAQGVPFMLSGEEILRTKPKGDGFDENSYKSSDATNSIKWDTLNDEKVADVLKYYKGLIAFRKAHAGLRMATLDEVQKNLNFIDVETANVVAYTIDNESNGVVEKICVVYNANKAAVDVKVPSGEWKVYIKNGVAGTDVIETITTDKVSVDAISCLVMVQGGGEEESTFPWWIVLIIALVAIVIIIAIIFIVKGKKKDNKKSDETVANVEETSEEEVVTEKKANEDDGKVYDVKLVSAGENPEFIANTICELTHISVAEAMDMVNNTPKVILIGVTKAEAEEIRAKLEAAGANITLE